MTNTLEVARKALETEIFATAIYSHLANSYPEKATRKSFSEVVDMEKGHVTFWSDFLKRRGIEHVDLKPSGFRLMLYKLMFRLIGKGLTLRMMEIAETEAVELYSSVLQHTDIQEKEKRDLNDILEDELVHEKMFLKEETKFEGFIAYIKDAVLGMNDGLVEILSVTTGLAGVSGQPVLVAIGGIIVGVAGALSMGISTYTSSRAQRQVHEGILRRIVSASKFVAHMFRERVSSHMEKKGFSKRLAEDMADESVRDDRLLSEFIAEEEYGLREESLGNPVKAGLYAGLSNLLGAFVPLLPYFFMPGIVWAIVLSLIFAAIALAITGFFVSILAYMSPGKKMGEMLLSGLGCAAITYVIGRGASVLLGTSAGQP